jgi:ClpP class serine protease
VLKQVSKFHIYKPKAIALSVDSLGESIVQGEIIAKAISNKAKELQCPYYTFAENLALGSGYLLLSSGNKVHVSPHSLIGGVSSNFLGVGLVKALKQWKIKNTTLATNEIHLNPLEDVKSADEKWIKDMLFSQNEALKNAIRFYRKQALV